MRKFDKQIIDLANEFKLTPQQVQYISDTFDFIDRFSFVETKNQLDSLCFEERVGKKFIYRDVPILTSRTVEMFLEMGKSVGSFYSQIKKEKNLRVFIKKLLSDKIQPSHFWERGVLTYKHLKREPMEDKTMEVIDYETK